MSAFHHLSPTDCLVTLQATPEGLTSSEAVERLAKHGLNRLPEVRTRGPLGRFLTHFNNVLIYVLLGAAVVTGALQHWVDTGVILAVVLANAVIGYMQARQEHSLGLGADRRPAVALPILQADLFFIDRHGTCPRPFAGPLSPGRGRHVLRAIIPVRVADWAGRSVSTR